MMLLDAGPSKVRDLVPLGRLEVLRIQRLLGLVRVLRLFWLMIRVLASGLLGTGLLVVRIVRV
jgi:hypothetical protein